MFDSIIFDLDGTLWDSTVPICESWNVVLKRHAEIKRPPVTINELGECMGLPMYDIAAKLFPLELWMNCVRMKMNIFQNMVRGFLTDLKMYYHYYQKNTGCL